MSGRLRSDRALLFVCGTHLVKHNEEDPSSVFLPDGSVEIGKLRGRSRRHDRRNLREDCRDAACHVRHNRTGCDGDDILCYGVTASATPLYVPAKIRPYHHPVRHDERMEQGASGSLIPTCESTGRYTFSRYCWPLGSVLSVLEFHRVHPVYAGLRLRTYPAIRAYSIQFVIALIHGDCSPRDPIELGPDRPCSTSTSEDEPMPSKSNSSFVFLHWSDVSDCPLRVQGAASWASDQSANAPDR